MRIGILSDNHGRFRPVESAARIFEGEGVTAIVHCGDVGGLESLEALVGHPIWLVWGNTDLPEAAWRPQARSMGIRWPDEVPLRIELGDRSLAVFHGHEPGFRAACQFPETDYVLHGHTHERADRRIGSARIINPGALHRAAPKTVAVLDPATDQLGFFTIDSNL